MNYARKSNGNRLVFIELLRFFFSLGILLYHFPEINGFKLFPRAYIAVEFFFIISGYFTIISIEKVSSNTFDPTYCLKFTFKKFRKIFIYTILAISICLIFFSIILKWNFPIFIQQLSIHLFESFLLQTTGIIGTYNNFYLMPLWYLSVLLFITPLFTYLYKNKKAVILLCSFIMPLFIYGYLIINYGTINVWGETLFGISCFPAYLRGIAGFSTGIAIKSIINENEFLRQKNWIKSIITTFLFFIILIFMIWNNAILSDIFALGCIIILLSVTFQNKTCKCNKKINSLLLFLGKFSLPLYIMHGVALVITDYFVKDSLHAIFYYLILTTLLSLISYILIEKVISVKLRLNRSNK